MLSKTKKYLFTVEWIIIKNVKNAIIINEHNINEETKKSCNPTNPKYMILCDSISVF